MPNRYMMLRVEGDEQALVEFLKMCAYMQRLGEVGASRNIVVAYDGDGAARLRFNVDGENLKSNVEGSEDSIKTGRDIKVYIGY